MCADTNNRHLPLVSGTCCPCDNERGWYQTAGSGALYQYGAKGETWKAARGGTNAEKGILRHGYSFSIREAYPDFEIKTRSRMVMVAPGDFDGKGMS